MRVSVSSSVRRARMMPFLPALEKKMSAKVGAITARKPILVDGPGGVLSREEPQPKFFSARRISAPLYSGLLRTKSGLGVGRPWASKLVAVVVEEEVFVAGALDALEELLGDDLVRVDVWEWERGGDGGDGVDGGHGLILGASMFVDLVDLGKSFGN